MKNWIRFIAIFLLSLTTLIGLVVFYNAQKPIGKAEEKAEEAAVDGGHLADPTRSYPMNGTSPSITVIGKDEEGRAKAVFVPDGKEGEISTVLMKEGISSKEAVSIVKKEMEVKKVLHVHLGTDGPGPLWEVAFVGPDDHLNYVYLHFKDGSSWKKILNI